MSSGNQSLFSILIQSNSYLFKYFFCACSIFAFPASVSTSRISTTVFIFKRNEAELSCCSVSYIEMETRCSLIWSKWHDCNYWSNIQWLVAWQESTCCFLTSHCNSKSPLLCFDTFQSAHLAMIDTLMMAYTVEMVSVEKVVASIHQYSPSNAEVETPYDTEDAVTTWINKVSKLCVVKLLWQLHTSDTQEVQLTLQT